ncbi:MAG: hypothetical protein DI533_09840 [Cereibacter sphaeroides]|uniref:SRPBCC family protein n=1 Tax=Cereibacter sphaeroides TaxID=1063 RepID=A0A2W5UBS0_CERSP|nr:MAG: hypothetical protein DI533_09840 [Cereibacter sphaeroides]
MKFAGREDIEAPIAAVFAALSDFDGWERAALRRGAEVQRTDALTRPGRGMAWNVGFVFRGKPRRASLRLQELDPPGRLVVSGNGANLDGRMICDLIEMSPRRTRIEVQLEVKPLTIGARLFVQSIRLARARTERRFRARLAQLAADIEHRQPRGRP